MSATSTLFVHSPVVPMASSVTSRHSAAGEGDGVVVAPVVGSGIALATADGRPGEGDAVDPQAASSSTKLIASAAR